MVDALPSGSTEPRIRGYICDGFARFIQSRIGTEMLGAHLRQRLEPAFVESLDFGREGLGFLPSAWYRADHVHRLLDASLDGLSPETKLRFAGQAGRSVFARQIGGLQKALFSMLLTPDRYARHIPKAWRHNFGSGTIAIESGEGWHRSTYTGWREYHPLVSRAMMVGKLEAYRAMGLDDARVYVERCDPELGSVSVVYWGPRSEYEPVTPTDQLRPPQEST